MEIQVQVRKYSMQMENNQEPSRDMLYHDTR